MMRRVWLALWMLGELVWGAAPIRWRGDYERARIEARQSGRLLLVVLVRRRSPACGELIRKMGEDAGLAELIRQRFVPVLVTEENEGYPLEMLYTTRWPTLFLLTQDERFVIEPIPGSVAPSLLRRRLEEKVPDE